MMIKKESKDKKIHKNTCKKRKVQCLLKMAKLGNAMKASLDSALKNFKMRIIHSSRLLSQSTLTPHKFKLILTQNG